MKTYNILFVVCWPIGGIRTFFRYVYRNFDSNKYHFTLVAPVLPETNFLLEDLAELDLRYVSAEKNVSDQVFFRTVTKLIRSGDFDLVHSHGFTAAACSTLGSLLGRIPHIVTLHETLYDERFIGLKGTLRKFALATMLSASDAIHCVSHDARDNLLDYFKILSLFEQKTIVIANGIEVERFLTAEARDLRRELGLPKNSFLIGFLGRYMPEKGFNYLIGSLDLIKKVKGLPLQPVLLSFGPEDAFIREEKDKVKRMGISDSVYFLPFVSDVASTLKGLDVIAIPSLFEAGPLLPMEAMVSGVPLIGTDCIGLREVLKGTPAAVVPARDSVALGRALILELKNPTTAKAREFAGEAAVRFHVKERAAEIERLMLKLLETR